MCALTSELHPLLSNEVVELLRRNEISTIRHFLELEAQLLSRITKLKFKTILVIRKHILNKTAAKKRNGLDYYSDLLQNMAIISSNHANLDDILGGGFYTGNLYEICSTSVRNVTRFVYKFVVDFLAKHENKQTVLYYDTKLTFNPIWLKYICDKQFGLGREDVILGNLLVAQVEDIYALFDALYDLKEKLEKKQTKLRIVIVDSLTAVLYASLQIEKCNMLLNCLINVMHLIAVEFHVCFILTNLLKVEQDESREACRVYGGKYWQIAPNVRLRVTEDNNAEDTFEVCLVQNRLGLVNQKCTIVL